MENSLVPKEIVINKVWQYSKHYGNLLSYCEQLSKNDYSNGHAKLIFLFNIMENVFKDKTCNFENSLSQTLTVLRNQDLITKAEFTFLNNKKNSVRVLRNILAHANLSKYNLVYKEGGKEVLYPLTENETCEKIYEMLSEIIFNLILRLITAESCESLKIVSEEKIRTAKIEIVELSPEQIMIFKGFDVSQISNWNSLNETAKYRIAENCSDTNMIAKIFEKMIVSLKKD